MIRPRGALLVAAPLLAFAVLGAGWQAVAVTEPSLLPSLADVGRELATQPGFYAAQAYETVQSAVLGLAAGVAVALVLAAGMVASAWLRAALLPVAVVVNVTPVVAIAPALVVAFGFGRLPHVLVVALVTFFPMLVSALTGLEAVSRESLDLLRALSARPAQVFWRLRVPSSLPYVFAGLQVCSTLAVIGAVVSEFTGTSDGIGATIVSATTYLDLPQVWAAIATSALTALALLGVVLLARRAVLGRWSASRDAAWPMDATREGPPGASGRTTGGRRGRSGDDARGSASPVDDRAGAAT